MINAFVGNVEMKTKSLENYLFQPFDCLLLVSTQINRLEEASKLIISFGYGAIYINKGLSAALLNTLPNERSRASQSWLKDTLGQYQEAPILCYCIDLLFHPSLQLDPFSLFRSTSRIQSLIVLWPGEYHANTLTYALPAHHHYRTWKLTETLLQQPKVIIQTIIDQEGD